MGNKQVDKYDGFKSDVIVGVRKALACPKTVAMRR